MSPRVKKPKPVIPPPLERHILGLIQDFFLQTGVPCYKLEQGFRPFACKHCGGAIGGGSRVTLGVPDLLVAPPGGKAFFVELKRPVSYAKRSTEQEAFKLNLEAAGMVTELWTSVEEAVLWWNGYRRRDRA